ncbi:MAG: DUF4150 domain-containing protein [Deltaproteobacteria bacterium]|nr:DUF4150 domain-containing protein [Deltaproteobacteria bacterium]
MSCKVFVNMRAITHANGQAKSINFPCVGKTPGPPAPFVPVPFPNISMGSDTDKASKKVKADGKPIALKDQSVFKTSKGNEAATAGGGLITAKKSGKSGYMMYSTDVKIEKKEVPRAFDIMAGNA